MNCYRQVGAVMWVMALSFPVAAEQGKLSLHVTDPKGIPVAHLEIATAGDGGGPKETDRTGRVILVLARDTKVNSSVSFQIVKSPKGHDYVMVSPWNSSTLVPSFENESNNYVEIVVAERGDKALLENPKALRSLAAKLTETTTGKIVDGQTSDDLQKQAMGTISKQYGLPAEEIDRAIRGWGAKSSDPYDIGLAALYERNYPEATKQLTSSLEAREENLQTAKESVVDAAFFLARSLYEQGFYQRAAIAAEKALHLAPDNPGVMSLTAVVLLETGRLAEARPYLEKLLEIDEKAAPNSLGTVVDLDNLGESMEASGDLINAEATFRKALAVCKMSENENWCTAIGSKLLAEVLQEKGNYADAEPLYQKALAIQREFFPSDKKRLAKTVSDLGYLRMMQGDLAAADGLFNEALGIETSMPSPDHPSTATTLSHLAHLMELEGKDAEAESYYRRALAIYTDTLGLNHISTAVTLNDLAMLLRKKKDYVGAESFHRRSLTAYLNIFGHDVPASVTIRNNLAEDLVGEQKYKEAESLFRENLPLVEKAFGPDNFREIVTLYNLAGVLEGEGDNVQAERLYRQSLTIADRTLGENDALDRKIRRSLAEMRAKQK
jgi:tetratricopeptide (TPR) repeat protein